MMNDETAPMLFRRGKLVPPADPRRVLERLEQLHTPVNAGPVPGMATTIGSYLVCAYDGAAWPCRERRIMEGEEDL
jgi:hypothetical protein